MNWHRVDFHCEPLKFNSPKTAIPVLQILKLRNETVLLLNSSPAGQIYELKIIIKYAY